MRKSSQSGQRNTARHAPEPHVGIFWVVDGKPLIDSTPLTEAEPYGDHFTHPCSHLEVWTVLRQRGIAPIDTEYEEHPRGRVIYDTKTCQFTMLADRCILKKRELVEKIKSELGLPKETKIGPDSHYRCFACLRERHAE